MECIVREILFAPETINSCGALNPMYIYQIPHTAGKSSQHFISVIDASGSMSYYWKELAANFNKYIPKEGSTTITFDHKARLCPDNILKPQISAHGGGSTNITAGFELMDAEIAKLPKKQTVTVLFVSDGQDDNLGSLEARLKKLKGHQGHTVNFICLGIQSQFPTFISMNLREFYHNGLPSIPALYLIEYYTPAALVNKFETMRDFFQHKKLLKVSPSVSVFPWTSPASQVYEGTWILCHSEELDVEGKKHVVRTGGMPLESLFELFRGYVQELQMLSLGKNPELKGYAGQTLETMRRVMAHYKEAEGIDLMQWVEDADLLKARFCERVKKQKLRHSQFRLKAYVESVEELAKGEEVKGMGEWEAAKKIGIGTITGTYAQKLFNLKNFTVDKYKSVLKDFIKVYEETKLVPGTDQEPSESLKQSQKDVFLEERFTEGLEQCESQFDLIESLPVVGLAAKVKRSLKVADDPWQCDVLAVTKELKAVNSLELFHNDYKMQWKGLKEEKLDFVNCVLPLLGPKEKDMLPLVGTKLFSVLMTFVVSQNADAVYDDAYLSLLANSLVYLIDQPQSKWKDELWNRILTTIIMVYIDSAAIKECIGKMLATPEVTVQQSNDLAKSFALLLAMQERGTISKEQAELVLHHICIKCFGILAEGGKYIELLKMSKASVLDKVKEELVGEFGKFNTLGELKRAVDAKIAGLSNDFAYSHVELNFLKLERLEQKVTLKKLNTLYEIFFKKVPDADEYLYWLYTAIKNKGKKLEARPAAEEVQQYFFGVFKDNFLKMSAPSVYADLKEGFLKKFREEHMYLTPISVTKLKECCDLRGLNIKDYQYVKELNLVKNACMCPKCPFFLKPQERLLHHLGTWSEKCPRAFHKAVKANLSLSPEGILEKVLAGDYARSKASGKQTLEEFDSNKDEALTYIKLLKEEYKKVGEEEKGYSEEIKKIESEINTPASVFHQRKKKAKKEPQQRGRGKPRRGKKKH